MSEMLIFVQTKIPMSGIINFNMIKRINQLVLEMYFNLIDQLLLASQRSACCHSHLWDRPSPKRVTVKQCTTCNALLSRDVSAACIILDIFEFQRQNQTKDFPAFIYM
jgi:hypothetical protein